MLRKIRALYRRSKFGALLLVTVILALIVIVFSCGFVMIKAYFDTPKVVAAAIAPEKVPLQLRDLPDEYRRILLTVEDPNFYSHHGVDLRTPGAGWTTITQGIVKIYFYDGFTPGTFRYRKLEQSLIALVFDARVSKETQLLIFINSAYFGSHDGRDVVGFRAAAGEYFHKDFAALTRDEFISLVAMIVGPNEFNVMTSPAKNKDRVNRINHLLSGACKPAGLTDVYYKSCG